MSRPLKGRESSHQERWLLSYADFITLLFAFFVVLYAAAQVDNRKSIKVSAAIQGGFQELGVGFSPSPSAELAPDRPPSPQVAPPAEQQGTHTDLSAQPDPSSNIDFISLKQELQKAFDEEIRTQQLEMRFSHDGLVISLREVGFFNSGDDTLLPGAEKKVVHIAEILSTKHFAVRVEGHTDNVPVHPGRRFRSNWELSTSRATQVVSLLVERCGFGPEAVAVSGYAEYHPVASNETEEGRRANRRVDLVVVSHLR